MVFVTDLTPEEVRRMVLAHNKILDGDNGRYVRRDVYERDLRALEKDVHEINDSIRWAVRLVVTQFVVLIVAFVIVLAQ